MAHNLDYSSDTAYIVIIIVALDEELLALLILSVTSVALGMLVSAVETPVSLSPKRIKHLIGL